MSATSNAQTKLIEELLDVSRIATGKLVLEKRRLLVGEMLEPAVEDARVLASGARRRADARGRLPGGLARTAIRNRLRQVLGNLLSNGIKFTPKGGRVTVDAALEPGSLATIEITVTDTGKGIEPSFLPHLFVPFQQADSSSTRAHAGLGIGLAIVRHLVELQAGSVRAESEGLGQGARFVLRFPLADAGAREIVESAPAPTEQPREPRLQGVRILVVDDEVDARASIEVTLKQYGAVVVAVPSAAEAMSALEREPIDVLLSDLAMPDEDGLSLIRRVRARPDERTARLPAAALSAYVRTEDRAETAKAGFDTHLRKPIEPIELAAAIEALLMRRAPESAPGTTSARTGVQARVSVIEKARPGGRARPPRRGGCGRRADLALCLLGLVAGGVCSCRSRYQEGVLQPGARAGPLARAGRHCCRAGGWSR